MEEGFIQGIYFCGSFLLASAMLGILIGAWFKSNHVKEQNAWWEIYAHWNKVDELEAELKELKGEQDD